MSVRFFILTSIILSSVFAKQSGSYGGRLGHYPASTGYSHPGTRVSHNYPQSNGLSGYSSGGTRQSHSYPHSNGLSGNTYTHQRQTSTYTNQGHTTSYTHKSEVHHHYHYSPPQYISYGSAHHPVYHSNPPVYVYEYRDSGSRFDSLLTGLALYNLGRMSAHNQHSSHVEYRGRPGEICKMVISKSNGDYEETRIDCKLISSFILEAEREQNNVMYTNTNIASTTLQNTNVVDALQVKGPSLQVTPGMTCYLIRISRDSSFLKKNVECGLLQAYARNSLRYNNCERCLHSMVIFLFVLIVHIFCNK